MTIDKKSLSERDICTKYITPAIAAAGWDVQTQVREEVSFTAGQIIVKGKTVKRGKAKRADNVRKRDYFTKYGEEARAVLHAMLEKYSDEGIQTLGDITVLKVEPLSGFGTPMEIIQRFGGKDKYLEAVRELEFMLYASAG